MRRNAGAMRPVLLVLATATVLTLAACADPSTLPTPAITVGGAGGDGSASSDQPPAGSDGVVADGMPTLPLEPCDELVDSEVSETEFDLQWSFEYVCTSRDPFDASVAALDALGTLEHPVNSQLGNESYIRDSHHFIGAWEGRVLDVNLALAGSPDDLEMTYLVTLTKD